MFIVIWSNKQVPAACVEKPSLLTINATMLIRWAIKWKKKKYCPQESNLSLFHSESNIKNANEFRYENKINVFLFKTIFVI